ncbi:MAG: T9SS type A sorting domain-containing protein [Bacteroidales bacterium]|nr:T9SS type A sorting domain-containing protein [Bacteroidales bacterium]
MKSIFSFIILFMIFGSRINAQDWQCIHDNFIAYYYSTDAKTTWTVNIDSVVTKDNYKYYYNSPIIRLEYSYYDFIGNSTSCYDPFSPSWIGNSMSAGDAGNFFFNKAGDGIRIRTDKHKNDSWICCRITDTTRLYAEVSLEQVDTVLGMADSVKYITFQAKNINGVLISHPLNNQVFKLSKSFGMLTLFDFYTFPEYLSTQPVHLLSGISTSIKAIGTQNITYRQVYSFAPGDVFHSYYEPYHMEITDHETRKTIRIILDSCWNSTGDTVKYKVARFIKSVWPSDNIPVYTYDLITEIYSFISETAEQFDNNPGHTSIIYDSDDTAAYFYYNQFCDSKYNNRSTKNLVGYFYPGSMCGDTLVNGSRFGTEYSYYIDGCGGEYYSHRSKIDLIHYNVAYNYLVYFKKGSETWGTPFDTSDWEEHGLMNNYDSGTKLFLYPNPAVNSITVAIQGYQKGVYSLEIVSLLGIKQLKIYFEADEMTIPVGNLKRGIYLLRLYNGNKLVSQKKLVKT